MNTQYPKEFTYSVRNNEMEKKKVAHGRFTSFFIKDIIATDGEIHENISKENVKGNNEEFSFFFNSTLRYTSISRLCKLRH